MMDMRELVVGLLSRFSIAATATSTLSSVESDGEWRGEAGVSVDLYECSKDVICSRLWPALLEAMPRLECAHIQEHGSGFQGCIYDWLRPSACPASFRRREAEVGRGERVTTTFGGMTRDSCMATSCPRDGTGRMMIDES